MRRLRKFLAMALALSLSAMALTGCVDQHPEEASASSGAAQSAASTAVEEDPRLVATSPATAQICDKLDLELVGVCTTSSTLPERYADLPTVGTAMSPDMEIVSSLNPDYVLSPNSLQSDLEPKYEAAGLNSIFLDLKSVEGMYDSIESLGEKFGRQEQAQALVDEYQAYMADYTSQHGDKSSPKVLILMGLPGSYIVATESSYVGNLVKLAGGENVYGDGDGKDFLNANTEDMLTKSPDIILRAAHALPDEVKQMFADEFETNDIWKHFSAVQNGKVYDLDPSLFNMSANFRWTEALDELEPLLYGD